MTTSAASLAAVQTLRWEGGVEGHLVLIDQTLLPTEFREIACPTVEIVWEAIKTLRVRGAPAIGVAAAYGVCVGIQTAASADEAELYRRLNEVLTYLASSRPTAVNLFWALDRMRRVGESVRGKLSPRDVAIRLLQEARTIEEEDRRTCRDLGRYGAALLSDGQGVLTHCNAGGLATADYGTALAVIFAATEAGRKVHVYADETRPLLQGARLTAWELKQRSIPVTLICDSMAAQVMREGRVQAVIVGADRIAANGDTANKIGTYSVAVLAAHHHIPFYVAAPSSTFDLAIGSGNEIPIEHRDPREVTHGFGRQTAPDGIDVYNPAFDVTPANLIAAFITERGIIRAPYLENLRKSLPPTSANPAAA
ncbi:MAG TPA: S-methyl-5-thioribose-1-phosphate isomerase [Planctomycetaceae bacterium]|jgi:methylthioribose-1-phosphate isomerase